MKTFFPGWFSHRKPVQGLICLLALVTAPVTHGAIVTLDTTDQGFFQQKLGIPTDGDHDPVNVNYSAGFSDINDFFLRNFFVFDLSSITTGTISSATLRLFFPEGQGAGGYNSNDASETFELFDYSTTPAADLSLPHSNRSDIFADLGSGTNYGSRVITNADELNGGSIIEITLNASALTDLNTAMGSDFVIGGAVTTLSASTSSSPSESIFGFTHIGPFTRQLELTVVPVPAALWLFGSGLLGLIGVSRQRKAA